MRFIRYRAVVTVMLGIAYIGGLLWSLVNNQMDAQSFIGGVGPAFGMALGYWFRDEAQT